MRIPSIPLVFRLASALIASGFLPKFLCSVGKALGFLGDFLRTDLLTPHTRVSAFEVQELRVCTTLSDLTGMENQDLIRGGDG